MSWRGFDTARAAARRRPFDQLERRLVRHALAEGTDEPEVARRVAQLRYAVSFARLTTVQNPDGQEVDLAGIQGVHAQRVLDRLSPHLLSGSDLRSALRTSEEIVAWTVQARRSLLASVPVDRDALEAEVCTRQLVIASGGGGGAGYVYPGVFEQLDRLGLTPSLMVGTSIGALLSMFRARRTQFDLAALLAAARVLSWTNVFRVLETGSRYGIPATLRLYLRSALGSLFQTDDSDAVGGRRDAWLSDLEIPLYTVVTGVTVEALKHDLHYYERLLADDVRTTRTMQARAGLRAMQILREFLSAPEALREIVVGREPGTEDFDVLDAAGFSAAIPAVIHYDVLREDARMQRILDQLYARHGITRLGEGGMVSNVPARIAWETAVSGHLGARRNVFVVALDCFAPSAGRLAWYPFQQMVRQANVTRDRAFADLYVSFPQTLSPLNLVPSVADAMTAIRWGRAAVEDHLPFVREMMRPLQVVRDREGWADDTG
ncbi:MAG: patatin-like phospholipase family protein [Alphaproteobacteria bacterium]|nr:patatin-like phospholipase family protein [Alphaproteobacteria bacterium]